MINGIDVSHHNNMKWKDIQKLSLTQNVYFAFCKASEGTEFKDDEFANNRKGSIGAGLLCGAYHFLLPTKDAVEQADNFAEQIGTLAAGELPPVVDIEWAKRGGKELWKQIGAKERITVTRTFLDAITNRLGVKPIIYTANAFWNEFIVGPNSAADYAFLVNYPLWIVNLKGALTVPKPWGVATFVQNSFGELAPPDASAFEKLDHDFFNGKLAGLLSLCKKGKVFEKGAPVSAIVRDFQQVLKSKGFYSKILDGDFGENTEKAVKAFQKSVGLTGTGKINEATWKMML